MKFPVAITCLCLSSGSLLGSDLQKEISQLKSSDFQQRENATASLVQQVQSLATSEEIDLEMTNLLKARLKAKSPETKFRLFLALQKSSLALKKSLGKPFLGIEMEAIRFPDGENLKYGVKITQLQPNSPAAKAGLKVGDRLTSSDNRSFFPSSMDTLDCFLSIVNEFTPGEQLSVAYYRGKKMHNTVIQLTATQKHQPHQLTKKQQTLGTLKSLFQLKKAPKKIAPPNNKKKANQPKIQEIEIQLGKQQVQAKKLFIQQGQVFNLEREVHSQSQPKTKYSFFNRWYQKKLKTLVAQ